MIEYLFAGWDPSTLGFTALTGLFILMIICASVSLKRFKVIDDNNHYGQLYVLKPLIVLIVAMIFVLAFVDRITSNTQECKYDNVPVTIQNKTKMQTVYMCRNRKIAGSWGEWYVSTQSKSIYY